VKAFFDTNIRERTNPPSSRSPDAARRCAAGPASIVPLALLWVPALRSSAKGAAPRPGHERNGATAWNPVRPQANFS
jgi:hypothetical protein